jgi:hypothetical protein
MEACPSAEFKRALVHTGAVDQKVRTSIHSGVERALELIGTRTLPDAMRATRVQRVVCFTGCFASNGSSSAADLLAAVLQRFIYLIKAARITVLTGHVYRFEDIRHPMRQWKLGR